MAERWRGTDGDRSSLRDLEASFNRAVLQAAMEGSGLDPLEGEVAYIYELLSGEEDSGRMLTRAERRLERAGVDVAEIRRDFVSHPTIGAHLKSCLSIDPPTSKPADQIERTKRRLFKMQNRAEAVFRSSLNHLIDTGRLNGDDIEVLISTQVTCSRCGAQYRIDDFFGNGGCRCSSSSEGPG